MYKIKRQRHKNWIEKKRKYWRYFSGLLCLPLLEKYIVFLLCLSVHHKSLKCHSYILKGNFFKFACILITIWRIAYHCSILIRQFLKELLSFLTLYVKPLHFKREFLKTACYGSLSNHFWQSYFPLCLRILHNKDCNCNSFYILSRNFLPAYYHIVLEGW